MGCSLGWAVVGCGWVARDFVVPAIQASANSRLIAACDPDPQALSALGGNGFLRTTSLPELLRTDGVDAVYIAAPNDVHRALTSQVAAAGKHVLCEKPMACNSVDARAMADACASAGVTLATAFDQRYHAAHRTLGAMVRQGRLGDVTQSRLHYACWLPPGWASDNWRIDPVRAGGGAVIDLAPHGLDLLETVLDDRIEQLVCMTQHRVHDYAVEDGGVLLARLASGTLATLHVGYNCPEIYPRRVLEIIGTRARALAVNTMGQTAGGSLSLIDAADGHEEAVSLVDDQCPFLLQIQAFADAVLDRRPYAYPAERDVRLATLLGDALSCH